MSAHVPALPLELDPLIAEAKQRARRRRWVVVAAVAVVAAAVVTTFALRSGGGTVGFCATPPPGWQERSVNLAGAGPTIVMTNFGFGNMSDFYGLGAAPRQRSNWPSRGIRIAVEDDTRWANEPSFSGVRPGVLRVHSSQFTGMEGSNFPAVQQLIKYDGRVLDTFVEIRTVTASGVAAANRALAGVHTCSS
jgi:hypothetical protein